MILVDTSLLVDCLRKRKVALDKLKEIENEILIASEITAIELYAGVHGADAPDEERIKVRELLGKVNVIEVNKFVRYKIAEVRAYLTARGRSIKAFDSVIAGTALVFNATIVARDGHYEKIRECFGANVECYSIPTAGVPTS
jgi:predicted nucleic acid-binding protein